MSKMTIKETAEALDVSVDTVRRRIKDNKIKAWKEQGQYGEQWAIDSDSLADYQHIIEAVPVKYNMSPEKLMDNIRHTVMEATQEAARKGTLEAMQENNKEIETLKNEITLLRDLIEQKQENKKNKTFIGKVKGIFKKK